MPRYRIALTEQDGPHFVCARCGNQSWQVMETRFVQRREVVRRRRKCLACGSRVTTEERIAKAS